MKRTLLLILMRDKSRVSAIITSLAMALAGMIGTRWLGYELTTEQNTIVLGVVTLALSYAFEILTTEVNARGIEKIQEASGTEVDRYAGPVTVAAVQGMADQAAIGNTEPRRPQ